MYPTTGYMPLLSDSSNDVAPEQILLLDTHLFVKAASKSFYTAFRVAPGQVLGKKLADIANGQWNIPPLLTMLNELLEIDGELPDMEMERCCPSPTPGTLLVNARRLLPVDGSQSDAILLSIREAPAQNRIEGALEFSEVRYRRLFEAAHDGILILDAATAKVVDVNPFMSDLLGYPKEHFLGKELWEVGALKDADIAKAAMAALQKFGHIRYEELPLQHKDGRHIPVEFVSNVYREGVRDVIQCNIRDITERKRLADELAKARDGAEAVSKAKSDFLANMSHEIRTPMSAILGFADMLHQKSPEECSQIGCVRIIRRNASHLLELINEILDLAKVEAGQLAVEHISCDLLVLLSEIFSLMRPRAVEKGLGFGMTFRGPIPRLIRSDPLRLRQILVNLIGNALKFTESGNIDVRIMEEGTGATNILLRIDVIDSGIGMAPELIERLFVPFTQGDESITRKFGGTGLGLTISRQLAKLLGGDVTVTSQPSVGSTFTMKIDGGPSAGVERLQDVTEATLPAKANKSVRAKINFQGRVLLVEDGADNQRLICMHLSEAGGSVACAANGQIAIDLATTQPFELILMDMQMPVLDGYAATIELRRRGLTTPIVALTAYAMAEDHAKCLAAGCSGYLSKPIEKETLLRTVSHYLGQPGHIRSNLAGDPQMMEIIPGYVNGLPGKVRKMMDFLKHNDLAALQRVVHQLSGEAGGYGFPHVTQPARRVEQSIRAGDALEPLTAEINSLIEVIRLIEGYDETLTS
jgi:PAS domain S-box-containing protein